MGDAVPTSCTESGAHLTPSPPPTLMTDTGCGGQVPASDSEWSVATDPDLECRPAAPSAPASAPARLPARLPASPPEPPPWPPPGSSDGLVDDDRDR